MSVTKTNNFEILLSTMNRSSLSFLEKMFPNDNFLNYNILIINQTTKKNLLVSKYDQIRVVNSFNKGLPQSRNLAIKNAKFDICLIADDDVEYVKDFSNIILNAFKNNVDSDAITFQMINENGELFKEYPDIVIHDKKSVSTVNSVVIAFKTKKILKFDVRFNDNFGLGSYFEAGNEYVFLRNILKVKLKLSFEPKIILSHPVYSSGQDSGSDRLIYARSALNYKYTGILAYLKLVKYIMFYYGKKSLSFNEILPKFLVGLKGIKKYKKLISDGMEIR